MQHVYQLEDLTINTQGSVVTIGVFDGMHRGHRQLIQNLVDEAHERGLLAGVMTFHPHPDEVLRGEVGRYYLTTVDERAALLAALGVDYLVTHPFNREVMQIQAADFVNRLVRHMNLRSLWVGADFALGYKRQGNVAFLTEQGLHHQFDVRAIDLVDTSGGQIVSSTLIRQALLRADLPTAQQLLGRRYSIGGEVIHGKKRGRQLGYPTANIAVPDGKLIPANGVYAGWAVLSGERFMAATNVGYSPTFGNDAVTVEAFLLDFDRDIYGETLTFEFEAYLRPEMKFDGLDALIVQMRADVLRTRELLSVQGA